jgi:hypothetical protein
LKDCPFRLDLVNWIDRCINGVDVVLAALFLKMIVFALKTEIIDCKQAFFRHARHRKEIALAELATLIF